MMLIYLPGWTGTIDELSVLDVCPLDVEWWCWEKWGWWPGKRGGGLVITKFIQQILSYEKLTFFSEWFKFMTWIS